MTNKKTKQECCHICGKSGTMSKEHIPPKAAFNNDTVFLMSMENWLRKENKGLKQMQGGFHKSTLCNQCNNNTGSWYGRAFVDFCIKGAEYLDNGYSGRMTLAFDIYPLRIIKQIVVMMLAINPPKFRLKHPELEKFVLSKKARYLSNDNKFYCYYKFGKLARYMGSQGIADVFKGETNLVSEMHIGLLDM